MTILVTPTKEPTTSSAILATLQAEAGNDRRRESLERLKAACDAAEATGGSFKLTDVQREVERLFGKDAGPRAQSISNEKKRPLGMYHYVEAREREHSAGKAPSKHQHARRADGDVAAVIDRIQDMDVRSAMHDLLDRTIVAEKSLARAKTLFKAMRPGAELSHLLTDETLGASSHTTVAPEHVRSLQQLLASLTDESRLNAVGLTLGGGRIRRKTGTRDELVPPGVLDRVTALLDAVTSRDQ